MLRNQNQNLNIVISEDTQKQFEVFRKGNIPNMAMILQVDPANQIVQCDGEPRVLTLTELREALPSTPRFVLYSYAWRRSDGRVQYPMCFIMFTPEDANPRHAMVYTAAKSVVSDKFRLGRMFELRDPEDLTEEWLISELSRR